jgi:O-antigen/teichoic acid export membrane protein
MKFPTTQAARALITTTLAYGVLEAGSRVLQALAIFLLAYWFRKDEFGEFYTYLAIYQLVTVFGTGGLLESLMNYFSRATPRSGAIAAHVRALLWRGSLTAVLFFFAMLIYAHFAHAPLNVPVLCAALIAGAMNGFVVIMGAQFTYMGENRKSIILRSIYALMSYSLSLLFAAATHEVLMYFWGQLLATVIVCGVLGLRERALLTVTPEDGPRVGADGSGWFLVPAILNWFFWYGLVVCVSSRFGTAQAADLAFANNIAQGLYIINLAVTQAWISRYLQHFASSRRNAELRTAFVFRVQSVVMLVAATGVIVVYELLKLQQMPLLVKYGNIGLPLAILLFAISASSNYFSAINAFAVNGAGRLLARISIGAYLGSLVFLLVAGATLGMLGVFMGLALLVMSRGFATAFYAQRRLHAGFFDWRLVFANVATFALVGWYYAG